LPTAAVRRASEFNADKKIAEAVAISGDTIRAVGTNESILRLSGDKTNVIDLDGKTVIPGLIDSHLHPDRDRDRDLDSSPSP
jgi:predicted amidohydrolase YtcJ